MVHKIVPIIFSFLILLNMPNAQAVSGLILNVETSKPCYYIDESVRIYGNLTYNRWPVQSVLVSLKVLDPVNYTVRTQTLQTNASGSYSTAFKLPAYARLGIYTVYVSAYVDERVTNSTMFKLTIIGDLDGDWKVDLKDVYIVSKSYDSRPGEPRWNPVCDVYNDNVIDLKDYYIVTINYGKKSGDA